MTTWRQGFRHRSARQAFVLLALLALLIGSAPRWHIHDHADSNWSAHHDDGESHPEGLHVHDIAAPITALLPSGQLAVALAAPGGFVPAASILSPPDRQDLPPMRPPI